ncbi:MAG: hypothetical protein HXX10_21335 [Rhodoplanes sp.]|uniref:hypothetical protein n=1 Tax=Rhodoplanes sp. TaxID=1968906 RepID=UPI0017FE21CB|nr:hypothetical protein [Rhodoplanes sp.]
MPTVRDLGSGVMAQGVLSRGLIGGHWSNQNASSADDFRAHSPRFQGDIFDRNLALVEALRGIAQAQMPMLDSER